VVPFPQDESEYPRVGSLSHGAHDSGHGYGHNYEDRSSRPSTSSVMETRYMPAASERESESPTYAAGRSRQGNRNLSLANFWRDVSVAKLRPGSSSDDEKLQSRGSEFAQVSTSRARTSGLFINSRDVSTGKPAEVDRRSRDRRSNGGFRAVVPLVDQNLRLFDDNTRSSREAVRDLHRNSEQIPMEILERVMEASTASDSSSLKISSSFSLERRAVSDQNLRWYDVNTGTAVENRPSWETNERRRTRSLDGLTGHPLRVDESHNSISDDGLELVSSALLFDQSQLSCDSTVQPQEENPILQSQSFNTNSSLYKPGGTPTCTGKGFDNLLATI